MNLCQASPEAATPLSSEPASFVGRQVCASCHQSQAHLYENSHHDLAMQIVNEASVLGDFNDATFTHFGVASIFFMRDGKYYVKTDGSDGTLQEFPIAYTFGVSPIQQYLIETTNGRLQVLSVSWDTRPREEGGQRWFHLHPDEPIPHDDALHWTQPLQNWNYMCAECHSTRLAKNYDPENDRFTTTWSEIDVSCESCHGPGSLHASSAQTRAENQTGKDNSPLGSIVDLSAGDGHHWIFDDGETTARRSVSQTSRTQVETCARCHSRRTQVWADYEYGQELAQTHRVELLEEGLYHADGQILDEVYVYGSFLQSPMHQAGVVCNDCHDPHSVRLLAEGNALCVRCHKATAFDVPEHHHHELGSSGTSCVSCHMPSRVYMGVDQRHDHSFRVPRPDQSVSLGTPNACNDCHDDQSAQWANDAAQEWFGTERSQTFHYGQAFDAGRRGQVGADLLLRRVIDDPESPGIVRSTAVALLGRYLQPNSLPILEQALRDDDPLVRRAAVGLLDAFDEPTRWRLAGIGLRDSVRSVRFETLATLASRSLTTIMPKYREDFDAAVSEYRRSLLFNADRVEAVVSLGNLDMALGRSDKAIEYYRKAILMDSSYIPASINLADLLRSLGHDDAGGKVLRHTADANPDSAHANHALGLLLIRQGRVGDAMEHLAKAVRILPTDARFSYVYAIALHDAGDVNAGMAVLEEAHTHTPTDQNLLSAMISFSIDVGHPEAALGWARKLKELRPNDPSLARLIQELEQ